MAWEAEAVGRRRLAVNRLHLIDSQRQLALVPLHNAPLTTAPHAQSTHAHWAAARLNASETKKRGRKAYEWAHPMGVLVLAQSSTLRVDCRRTGPPSCTKRLNSEALSGLFTGCPARATARAHSPVWRCAHTIAAVQGTGVGLCLIPPATQSHGSPIYIDYNRPAAPGTTGQRNHRRLCDAKHVGRVVCGPHRRTMLRICGWCGRRRKSYVSRGWVSFCRSFASSQSLVSCHVSHVWMGSPMGSP